MHFTKSLIYIVCYVYIAFHCDKWKIKYIENFSAPKNTLFFTIDSGIQLRKIMRNNYHFAFDVFHLRIKKFHLSKCFSNAFRPNA